MEGPVLLGNVEDIGHWRHTAVMKVLASRAEDVFDRAGHVYGGVVLGDDGMMLYVRTNNIGRATVGIHVIAPILCVVFNNENEGARRLRL